MTLQQWIDAVDSVLVAQKRFYRVRDIDPVAIQDAYNRGDSPVLFGKLDRHAMRGDGDSGYRSSFRISSWAIVGMGVFAALAAFYVGRGLLRDREGARIASKGPFPRRLPYDATYGMYTPPDAEQALTEAKEEVGRQMMLRSSAVFREVTVDKILGPGEYLVTGEVEGKNKYGARLSTPFEARAAKRSEGDKRFGTFGYSGNSRLFTSPGSGWVNSQRGLPKIGEWRVFVRMDRGIGDSQIDRGPGPRTFNPPRAARASAPPIPQSAPAVYTGDADAPN